VRDLWIHRVDLARTTGRPLMLGAHDREIVAQVIADLGRAWQGRPVLLELTGPAGDRWTLGQGAPVTTVRADAVDYLRPCRAATTIPPWRSTAISLSIRRVPGVGSPRGGSPESTAFLEARHARSLPQFPRSVKPLA
jgi:hypothetical protein